MAKLLDELESLSVLEYSSRRRGTAAGANVFADDTHGEVALDEFASQLLNTRPFHRMDNLKQLGCASWRFPGAVHTRRQHSLGVAHLAVECALQLYRNGANNVTAEDLMLLGVAGLLHDVGHGPFSHVFESQILPRLGVTGWKHEDMSEGLIDHLAASSSLDLSQQQWGRVKDMIRGRTTAGNGWGQGLEWIPSVVAGDADMDRGDYLMRDAMATGVLHSYDARELMRCSKVLSVEGVPTICYAESGQAVLAAKFEARALMHEQVYQQQHVKAVECMLADALAAANHVLRIPELASSPGSFLALDDGLLSCIRREGHLHSQHSSSSTPSLRQAAAILARVDAGDYYPLAAERDVTGWDPRRLGSCSTLEQHLAGFCSSLTADDVRVVYAEVGHGRKGEDPMAYKLRFDAQLNTQPANEGLQRPAQFSKRLMRVYLAKHSHNDANLLSTCTSQLQAALDRLLRQLADSPQQQQQSGICSITNSSLEAPGACTPMPLPRALLLQPKPGQLASPEMITPVVAAWQYHEQCQKLQLGRKRQQQQQQQQQLRSKVQRQMHSGQLLLQLEDEEEEHEEDEEEYEELLLQQQQQQQQQLKDLKINLHGQPDDYDMLSSQLSQRTQEQLPFAFSQSQQQ